MCPMDTQIHEGKEVTVLSAHGQVVRVVVDVLGDIITVCRREEFEQARAEGRKPISIGFKRSAILV